MPKIEVDNLALVPYDLEVEAWRLIDEDTIFIKLKRNKDGEKQGLIIRIFDEDFHTICPGAKYMQRTLSRI